MHVVLRETFYNKNEKHQMYNNIYIYIQVLYLTIRIGKMTQNASQYLSEPEPGEG